jgi:hypothetical protein
VVAAVRVAATGELPAVVAVRAVTAGELPAVAAVRAVTSGELPAVGAVRIRVAVSVRRAPAWVIMTMAYM